MPEPHPARSLPPLSGKAGERVQAAIFQLRRGGGVIVVEVIFAWPGLGRLTLDAVRARDYPVVQGAVLLVAALFLLVNLVVDLLYAAVDPRIRYSR